MNLFAPQVRQKRAHEVDDGFRRAEALAGRRALDRPSAELERREQAGGGLDVEAGVFYPVVRVALAQGLEAAAVEEGCDVVALKNEGEQLGIGEGARAQPEQPLGDVSLH